MNPYNDKIIHWAAFASAVPTTEGENHKESCHETFIISKHFHKGTHNEWKTYNKT